MIVSCLATLLAAIAQVGGACTTDSSIYEGGLGPSCTSSSGLLGDLTVKCAECCGVLPFVKGGCADFDICPSVYQCCACACNVGDVSCGQNCLSDSGAECLKCWDGVIECAQTRCAAECGDGGQWIGTLP
jgi:hypothetical protein